MTQEQRNWLANNPDYSPVRNSYDPISLYQWSNQGWLWPDGHFRLDDGQTYFYNTNQAIRVGRRHQIIE